MLVWKSWISLFINRLDYAMISKQIYFENGGFLLQR